MRSTGPSRLTRMIVLQRAAYHCELCNRPISSEMSIHHRKPRRMGGTRRPEVNEPTNLLVLCGSGTTGCHGWIESDRLAGYATGVILYNIDNPGEKPFRDRLGNWWTLTPEGTKTRITPPSETGVGLPETTKKGTPS